jgi:hypothetical protein
MAVHIRRDEEVQQPQRRRDPSEDQALLLAGMWVGARATTLVAVPAAGVLILILRALRPALVAADKLLRAGGDHWSDLWMPAALLGLYGLVIGGLLGWRVTSAASVGRPVVWALSGAGIALILAVGIITAALGFPSEIPIMCWIALGLTAVAAVCGVYLAILWVD